MKATGDASAGRPVLHCFDRYLPMTENWIYRQLHSMRDTLVLTAACTYLPGSLWDPRFRRIRYPIPNYSQAFHTHLLDAIHFKSFRFLWRGYGAYVSRAARACGVEVMHSHFAPSGWIHREVAARIGRPHVISFYGYDYVMLPRTDPAWSERYEALFESAQIFLSEGPHAAALLERLGCPKHKIRIVPIGVDVQSIPFVPRRKPAGRLRLVQVASFREKKGHVYALEAFIRVAQRCPGLELTFIGHQEGDIYEGLVRRAEQSNCADRIRFLPAMHPDELHASLGAYDLFIHPSVHASDGDCEGGAPIVLLDAQATGMPCLSTFHCDIPEEVRQGETGRLIPERDVEATADAMEAFHRMDADEFERLSRGARAHVMARFDVRESVRALEQIYTVLATGLATQTDARGR